MSCGSRNCVNFVFFICIISNVGCIICTALSIYFWIDLEENILQQLESVELIPNFLSIALSVASFVASCVQYSVVLDKSRFFLVQPVKESGNEPKYNFFTDSDS